MNRTGTRWTFRGGDGAAFGGVTRVYVTKSIRAPGLYTFRVRAKNADFQVVAAEIPVQLRVVLGGEAQMTAGQCATRAFNPPFGPTPACKYLRDGNILSCR